jgi:aminopeptidase N
VLTLPNFYPLIPVYDDEGWNVELAPGYGDAVYSDTALYQVSISAPADQRVVASGVCEASADGANQIWRCVSGPMRDFMIAMSADYVAASTQIDGITINSYALTQDSKAGERGLDYVARAVQTYEKRIGQYPFTELDLIETPTTAGGIEYPGVIVVAEQVYADAQAQEFTTVHESAHQWWYSLVGNDQVEEPWIDESLTQYTSILYFRDRYGADQAQFLVAFVFAEPYDRAKKAGQDLRADLPVAGYSESQYGAIVYGKAPLFFDALHEAIGDEKYNVFMRTYFERYRYGIATAQDLLDAAATQVDRARLDTLIQKWITTPEK